MKPQHNILVSLALACSLSFAPTPTRVAARQQGRAEDPSAQKDDSLPLFVRYGILFRRLAGSQSGGQDSGTPGTSNESRYAALLQREVPLSVEQTRELLEVAGECQRQVAEVDARAKAIIETFRSQNPPASQSAPGERPPPPPELAQLQQERNSVILRAREKLRAAFGEETFRRFDSYVASHGNGRTFTLPPAGRPPVSLQATVTALSADGQTPKRQFRVGEKVLIQVALLNNSSRPIGVRLSDLYDWFELSRVGEGGRAPVFMRPPEKGPSEGAQAEQRQDVELSPGQQTVVGTLDLGEIQKFLRPGQYVMAAHPRVLLNRPPDQSVFVNLTSTDDAPVTFEILP
jgi:hypothetical protein